MNGIAGKDPTAASLSLGKAWAIARRELRWDLRGLRLLFICLFLGVATLAAIGSLSSAISSEIANRGQSILGGDIEISMTQREISAEDKTALQKYGILSETIRLRAMAIIPENGQAKQADGTTPDRILTELKGVDDLYPLYGKLELQDKTPEIQHPDDGSVFISTALQKRLGLSIGDRIKWGEAEYNVHNIILDEPDRVGEGFTLGPVAITTLDGLRRSGLIQPGSLYSSKYRLKTSAASDVSETIDRLEDQFSARAWQFKSFDNAAPRTDRFIRRMGQFLSLIGLAALAIAGIGVSNAVSAYLGQRRKNLAILKILGATSRDIARIYLMQISIVIFIAIIAGLIVGAALPSIIVTFAGDILPVKPGFSVHPVALFTAAAYGLFMALAFVIPPLEHAKNCPAASLFRGDVGTQKRELGKAALVKVMACFTAIFALVLITADRPLFSASVLGAVIIAMLIFYLTGQLITWAAAKIKRPSRPLLRLAITNIYRPGSATGSLVTALGLALTLFVTMAAIDTSLNGEIDRIVPNKAPDYFVLDIPSDRQEEFATLAHQSAANADINIVPALRGTITKYGDTIVNQLDELPDGAWFLRGERGVTYSHTLPEGSELTKGEWWPDNYQGKPLVSLDEEAAQIMGLDIGDTLTVNILGREMVLTIASLRTINWENMGFNYIMALNPSALDNAPHSLTASISLPDRAAGSGASEISRDLLAAFPMISLIEVGDIITQVSAVLDQMASAIFIAASVTILAGIAVLIGTLMAARQARSYDSVIMKILGATRKQILLAQLLEYLLISLLLAGIALALGLGSAWFVIVQIFEFAWSPDMMVVGMTLLVAMVITMGISMLAAIPLMSVRPAQALRSV